MAVNPNTPPMTIPMMSEVPKLEPDCDMSARFQRWIAKWLDVHKDAWIKTVRSWVLVLLMNRLAETKKQREQKWNFSCSILYSHGGHGMFAQWRPQSTVVQTITFLVVRDEILTKFRFGRGHIIDAIWVETWRVSRCSTIQHQAEGLGISFECNVVSARALRYSCLRDRTCAVSRLTVIASLWNIVRDAST